MKSVIFKTTYLILSWISDQSLGVSKCNIGGSCPITLVIGNDLHLAMLENSNTGVGGAQIYPNRRFLGHVSSFCDKIDQVCGKLSNVYQ